MWATPAPLQGQRRVQSKSPRLAVLTTKKNVCRSKPPATRAHGAEVVYSWLASAASLQALQSYELVRMGKSAVIQQQDDLLRGLAEPCFFLGVRYLPPHQLA